MKYTSSGVLSKKGTEKQRGRKKGAEAKGDSWPGTEGASATLSLANLAFSTGPGLAKPDPSGAATRVCVDV